MRINEEFVFEDKNGKVYEYTLRNDKNIEVKILNLGGIITGIYVPDRNGILENIVVGWKNYKDYTWDSGYTGALVGRTAGRIADGKITINKENFQLSKNSGNNTLHGGNIGFNKKLWNVTKYNDQDEVGLILESVSKDGEEGYPGNVILKVKYSLNNNNELSIEYYGTSDKDTLLNMTNHSYFNLSGNLKRSVLDEFLTIKSNKFAAITEDGALSGKLIDVNGTEFDFNYPKEIGKDINGEHNQLKLGNGYDHPWSLEKNNNVKVRLEDKGSGRTMEVYTDREAVVVYTTNYPEDNKELYSGGFLKKNYAICFETQSMPIGKNETFLDGSILRKGEEYKAKTIFKFTN